MEFFVEVGWGELGADLQDDLVHEVAIETGMNTEWVRELFEKDYANGGFCGKLTLDMKRIIG